MKSKYQKYNNLIKKVNFYTEWIKVRKALFEEYKAGRFYSLPFDMWNAGDEGKKEKIEFQEMFEICMDK